jgi:hypothetical protein
MLPVAIVSVAVAATVATAAVSAPSSTITQTSIAGARVGLTAAAYQKLFGSPSTTKHDHELTLLIFPKREIAVLFVNSINAMSVITWNKAYRTDHGVGPCSTFAQLTKAYGAQLVHDWTAQGPIAYDAGNLIFATPTTKTVAAVALYNSRAPHAQQGGGAHPYSGFAAGFLVPKCS